MPSRVAVWFLYWTGHFASKLIFDHWAVPGAFRYYQWAMRWSSEHDDKERIWKRVPRG